MEGLENYNLKNFYKGVVLKTLEEGKLLIYIHDLILSKPHSDVLQENIATNNIINSRELQITNVLSSMNGVICRPLYINGELRVPNVGDTVFVMLFDNDPKKIFYINISNDRPIENNTPTRITISDNATVKHISDNIIEITGGKVVIELKGDNSDVAN